MSIAITPRNDQTYVFWTNDGSKSEGWYESENLTDVREYRNSFRHLYPDDKLYKTDGIVKVTTTIEVEDIND